MASTKINASKFLSAPLNAGTRVVTTKFGKSCYCIFGAYFKAIGVDTPLSLKEHYRHSWTEEQTGLWTNIVEPHERIDFQSLEADPIYKVLKLAESELIEHRKTCEVSDEWDMQFKRDVLSKLIAAGAELIQEAA